MDEAATHAALEPVRDVGTAAQGVEVSVFCESFETTTASGGVGDSCGVSGFHGGLVFSFKSPDTSSSTDRLEVSRIVHDIAL
jgi:hypothetical protein